MNFLIVILFFIQVTTFAQKGIVYYGEIKSPGMRSAAGPDLNSFLVFDENQSYYVTAKDSLEVIPKTQAIYQGSNEQQVVYTGDKTSRYGEQVYFNREKDSSWWSQRFGGNIYIAEKRPEIDWKLQPETKKIGNFNAHKAVGKFRGREYTAWYTLEVSLPYGPWKLQGLPGIILEAYDEKKEMYLYFKSLEYPTKNKTRITQVNRVKSEGKAWKTIDDFEDMLRKSLIKAYNGMVLRAERNGTEKPEKPVFSEIYIESFE